MGLAITRSGMGGGARPKALPKRLIGRSIAEGFADTKAGRIYGPYNTAEEASRAGRKRVATKKPR